MDFYQISILLVVAAVFGIVARIFKQPVLIGYLFAGLGLSALGVLGEDGALTSLAQIGVTLLLFLVGLEMNLKELPTIGKTAVITGLGQILFTITGFFLITQLLGFSVLSSIYIAVAFSFSSTIIIIKLLSEKNDLDSLYGKIAVGFLLVQDFVAIIILMFLSGYGEGGLAVFEYLFIGVKAIALFIFVWLISKHVLPVLFYKYVSRSSELLFITSIAWALGFASFVAGPLSFTVEIGGFLAGIALSNLPEHLQIASRTRPLRDFFLTIFFLLLGTKLVVGGVSTIILPAIIFSALVLVGNPLIVIVIMSLLGYRSRTSFLSSVAVAQISEFSFILMGVGAALGHVSASEEALVIVVGAFTMTLSAYLILNAEKLYSYLRRFLVKLEKRSNKEVIFKSGLTQMSDHVIVIGWGRTGKTIVKFLRSGKIPLLVVDHNPSVFTRLYSDKVPVLFGDIDDPEVQESIDLERAKMVISTISDMNGNLSLLAKIKKTRNRPLSIFRAEDKDEAFRLYEHGATYVVVPEVAAGESVRHILDTYGFGRERIIKLGKGHFNRLMYI